MTPKKRYHTPFFLRWYPYAWVERTWWEMMFIMELSWRAEKVFRSQEHNMYAPGFIQPRTHVWNTDAK